MASMWRRAMLYLGLGPDDEYDGYDGYDRADTSEPELARPGPPAPNRYPVAPPQAHNPEREPQPAGSSGAVRTTGPKMVRPLGSGPDPAERPRTAAVRPLEPVASGKPYVVAPSSFNHVQEVADKLKVNQPVIVNLQNVDRDLSRRIIDFASGLCYGIGGQMERVANQVFLLTPTNVEVSAEERRRLQEHGYHEG